MLVSRQKRTGRSHDCFTPFSPFGTWISSLFIYLLRNLFSTAHYCGMLCRRTLLLLPCSNAMQAPFTPSLPPSLSRSLISGILFPFRLKE